MTTSLSAILTQHEETSPLLTETIRYVLERGKIFQDSIIRTIELRGDDFWASGERFCQTILQIHDGDHERYRVAVDGYIKICFDHLKEQAYLMAHGKYRSDKFEQVTQELYTNEEAMQGYYLDGLLMTYSFWPNHFGLYRFFKDRLVPFVPDGIRFLDIGVGHGLYFAELLGRRPECFGYGLDIGQSALDYTRKMLRVKGIAEGRYHLFLQDVRDGLDFPDASFECILLGEVLEHLENPLEGVLKEVYRLLKPGGYLFTTTCINCGSSEHIYLFHTVDEIRELLRQANLNIIEEVALPLREASPEEMLAQRIVINYAGIATRD